MLGCGVVPALYFDIWAKNDKSQHRKCFKTFNLNSTGMFSHIILVQNDCVCLCLKLIHELRFTLFGKFIHSTPCNFKYLQIACFLQGQCTGVQRLG